MNLTAIRRVMASIKGIDVELAEEAFQRLGYQPEFEKVVWEDKRETFCQMEQ